MFFINNNFHNIVLAVRWGKRIISTQLKFPLLNVIYTKTGFTKTCAHENVGVFYLLSISNLQ